MNYQEYKDFLITFLWRTGDQQLISNLDSIIKMGETTLSRALKIEDQHKSMAMLVTSLRMEMPDDFKSVKGIAPLGMGDTQFSYVTPSFLNTQLSVTGGQRWQPIYSIENRTLLFCGPATGGHSSTGPTPPPNPQAGDQWLRTTVSPGLYVWEVDINSSQWVQLNSLAQVSEASQEQTISVVVDYYSKFSSFKMNDVSVLEEEHLDLFTYACLKHTAPFLREDERLQTWNGLYAELLEEARYENALDRDKSVADEVPLPRIAGIQRKRR